MVYECDSDDKAAETAMVKCAQGYLPLGNGHVRAGDLASQSLSELALTTHTPLKENPERQWIHAGLSWRLCRNPESQRRTN